MGDEMPKLRPYCFGRSCLSVEMLQCFVLLDFVLIFSPIQIFRCRGQEPQKTEIIK